jgi:uncharacterized membrane protein AbrB (regulator of aidB expression)
MFWRDWLNISFIQHVFRHIFGWVLTVLLFEGAALIVGAVIPPGAIRDRVDKVDSFVLLALLIILGIQLGISLIKEVWKQLRGGWNGTQVLAV